MSLANHTRSGASKCTLQLLDFNGLDDAQRSKKQHPSMLNMVSSLPALLERRFVGICLFLFCCIS
jgi:hypothetical protein